MVKYQLILTNIYLILISVLDNELSVYTHWLLAITDSLFVKAATWVMG